MTRNKIHDVRHIDMALDIIKNFTGKSLINIFNVHETTDLDTAMMKAVVLAQTSSMISDMREESALNLVAKISSAIEHNKSDLVRDETFSNSTLPNKGKLFDQAIRFKKARFLDLLFDSDFKYSEHLNSRIGIILMIF